MEKIGKKKNKQVKYRAYQTVERTLENNTNKGDTVVADALVVRMSFFEKVGFEQSSGGMRGWVCGEEHPPTQRKQGCLACSSKEASVAGAE